MKRQDWVWAFAKAFGIWLLVQAFRNLIGIVQSLVSVPEGGRWYGSWSVYYILTFAVVLAAGLILLLRTGWVMRFAGAKPEEEEETPEKAEEVWSSPEGRKNAVWVFIKGLGVYFAFMAIVKIPLTILWLSEALGGGKLSSSVMGPTEGLSAYDMKWIISAVTEYVQLGIGICLIVFTDFFVRLVARRWTLSDVKDGLKYRGGEEQQAGE